jgi:hypothetical protein
MSKADRAAQQRVNNALAAKRASDAKTQALRDAQAAQDARLARNKADKKVRQRGGS